MRINLLVVLALIVVFSATGDAAYLQVDAPEYSDKAVLVADLLDYGKPQIIVGGQGNVTVYTDDKALYTITNVSGRVTSLAIGDLTGDFRPELLVGTDNAGAFYIYQLRDERFRRLADPQYLWSPVRHLQVADINGDGWGDILALTDKGEAVLYLSWEGELFPFWRSEAGEQVAHLVSYDVTGDGNDELIYARSSGYVAVWQWREHQLELVWENYPWGNIEGLIAGLEQNSSEIMAITGQKMVYGWQWDGQGFQLHKHFHAPELGRSFQPWNNGVLSFSSEDGVSYFTIESSRIRKQWNIPFVTGTRFQEYQDKYLVSDGRRVHFWLEPVADDYFELHVNGTRIEQSADVAQDNGDLLLNWENTANLLAIEGFYWATVVPGTAEILWGDMIFPLTRKAVLIDDSLYVPVDAFAIYGWNAEIDMARRRVNFTPHWGWW